jgi:hypothetical protein
MLRATKSRRSQAAVDDALRQLRDGGRGRRQPDARSVVCARARVTTGEWADALRAVFGEYRPPTGVEGQRLVLENDRVDAVRAAHGAWGDAARRPAAHRASASRARRPLERLGDDRRRRARTRASR